MKNFTLLATLFLVSMTGFSQEFGGTPPNCTLPAGFIISQGDKMVTYQNPLKNCADDCGILTPGVGGNNPGNIVMPAEIYKPTLSKTFSIFLFDANGKCSSDKNFACSTWVSLYIVDSSYNSVQSPDPSQSYGESQPFLLKAHGAPNSVNVAFTKTADPTKPYRVFLDFGKGTPCTQSNTKYIIDFLPEGGPLPVNVSSFLVGRTGTNVALNWKTEIEMNALTFEVQRSYDNANFKTIATVAGIVNGSSTKSYSYIDNSNTSNAVSFYRLKIVKQSEVNYSDIRTVKGISAKAGFIFPNPAVSNSKITISDISEASRVQVLDNSGRLIKTIMLNNTNTIELTGMQKGTYLVRITGTVSGHTEIRKLTVIN